MTKYSFFLWFLSLGHLCLAQSNVVELSSYELKGNVSKVKTTLFYPSSQTINRVSTLMYKDGFIQSLDETFPETQIRNSYVYSYQQDKTAYTLRFTQFYNNQKTVDSVTTFQRVKFQQLSFYYPQNQLKLHQRNYPESLDITYRLSLEEYYTQLIFEGDSTVREVNNFEDFKEQHFNKKGQIMSQQFSNKYLHKYYYNEKGQLISDVFFQNLMKRSQDRPMKTIYFYEHDSRGNWIKKLSITLDYLNKMTEASFMSFESRRLNYEDGFTSGSSKYDTVFIRNKIASIK